MDADWKTWLCVPQNMVNMVLRMNHDVPYEGGHGGPKWFISQLRESYYWPRLSRDAELYTLTCNVCQKTKVDHQAKRGGLRPAHIPKRPFSTMSLDLITGLPPSGELRYTAILVIVDKLSKYALFIPMHNELSTEGFAKIFMERIVHVFGLPDRIITD